MFDRLATKQDLQAMTQEITLQIQALKQDMVLQLQTVSQQLTRQLTLRMGVMMAVGFTVMGALLKLLP